MVLSALRESVFLKDFLTPVSDRLKVASNTFSPKMHTKFVVIEVL